MLSQRLLSIRAFWSLSLSVPLVLGSFLACLLGSNPAFAYDVCADDDACTHEIMTDEALDLFLARTSGPLSAELSSNRQNIRAGVGIPDEYDPIYDNGGDIIKTISHLWHADSGLGRPMIFDTPTTGNDDYPNAYNAAQALWMRALGEYAVGNTAEAYRYLGMVAHFLGDQSIPTHAHGDTHGPDFLDDDTFEEWMSVGPNSPKAYVTGQDYSDLYAAGILESPEFETEDQLLWLFLTTNQVADYFTSDGDGFGYLSPLADGDSINPNDPAYPWTHSYPVEALRDLRSRDTGWPKTRDRMDDNDPNPLSEYLFYPNNNDMDGDLTIIRKNSYLYGVRAIGGLFALWEEAVARRPILRLTVLEVREVGNEQLVGINGLDDFQSPDLYVGMVMGYNQRLDRGRSPVGAYLQNRSGNIRTNDGLSIPAAMTRRDVRPGGPYENLNGYFPNYHFGQSYPFRDGSLGYGSSDVVEMFLTVWDDDVTVFTNDPYSDDDAADINPSTSRRRLNIEVDMAACLAGNSGAITIPGAGTHNCNSLISIQASDGQVDGTSDDDDVKVAFAVGIVLEDEPPEVSCAAPAGTFGVWRATNASIPCTASDSGTGLLNPSDASFSLSTNVAAGAEIVNASTGSRSVCDAAGNCRSAGPVSGIRVDRRGPTITQPADITFEATGDRTAVAIGDATADDQGSGVAGLVTSDAPTDYPIGTTLVTWSATDNVGNTTTAEQSITVVDTTAPVVVPPPDINVFANATISSGIGYASATDALGVVDITRNPTIAYFPVGKTTITWTATDAAGNVGTATQTVTAKERGGTGALGLIEFLLLFLCFGWRASVRYRRQAE